MRRRRRGWASVRNSTTSPAAVERAFRMREACELRSRGLSYEGIGQVMGLAPMTVWQMIQDAIASAVPPERIELERRLELSRLDTLQASIYFKAATGGHGEIALVLRLMEMRAKLLGIV